MKLLIDTNILIPLDPATDAERGAAPLMAEVFLRAQRARAEVYYHPASLVDFARDGNAERRKNHEADLAKYLKLPSPPTAADLDQQLGAPTHGSNDWVDNQLVIALKRNAADLLVSDDDRVRKKARRLGLEARVLTAREASSYLREFYDDAPPPPPALAKGHTHDLDENDPFFDSFVADYEGFKDWLVKTKPKHRDCWNVKDASGHLEALAIVKREEDSIPAEVAGRKVLKICTFKVAEAARGRSLGEQLLKAVFGFAYENKYEAIFVTLFETKQVRLADDLADFGFNLSATRLKNGEAQMWKLLAPPAGDSRSGLDAHVAFGPRHVDFCAPAYAVPILPKFVEQLFPEQAPQAGLLPKACANAMRKAYLCRSKITPPPPGSVLAFYRTHEAQGVVAIGVVEGAERHDKADAIAGAVGKRTVYTQRNIEEMTDGGRSVLAIRFREARLPRAPIALETLRTRGMLTAAPQSITQMKLTEENRTWIDQVTRA